MKNQMLKKIIKFILVIVIALCAYFYEEYFEGFLKEGKDILHLCLSSGISSYLS